MGSNPFAGTKFLKHIQFWPTGVMAARLYHTEKVLGSIPRSATNFRPAKAGLFLFTGLEFFKRLFECL